jgi:hypothetical protein
MGESGKPMIPRQIAFFWSGPRMSFMRYLTLRSFRHQNPDWQMTLYSPDTPCADKTWATVEQDDSGYSGADCTSMVDALSVERKTWTAPLPGLSHSHASDLFEWDLLATVGGFYSDMDVLWLRPIEPLYQQHRAADALFSLEDGGTVCPIGFFAASQGCPIFQDIRTTALSEYMPQGYETAGTLALYRAAGLTCYTDPASKVLDAFRHRYPGVNIAVAPDETLYCYGTSTHPAIFQTTARVPNTAIGLHWFGGSPISQEWNRKLTAENWRNFDNIFTRQLAAIHLGG